MNTPLAVLLTVLSVAPAAAQTVVGTYQPKSCGKPAQELERVYDLRTSEGKTVKLVYTGCSEGWRTDYFTHYTERDFSGDGGWSMSLITNHGDGAYGTADETRFSEVVIWKDNKRAAANGRVENAKLVSGSMVKAGTLAVNAYKPQPPAIPQCEKSLPKPVYGPNELWLVTKTKAYYYHEDCDICAELDSCDLKTGKLKEEIVAHMVSCSDLDNYKKGEETVYDGCSR